MIDRAHDLPIAKQAEALGISRGSVAQCSADRAYRGERVGSATAITVEIVEPEEGQRGFAVQPRRWAVERTFGWIARCRRLARDHEATTSAALAFFVLAATVILVRRLAKAL